MQLSSVLFSLLPFIGAAVAELKMEGPHMFDVAPRDAIFERGVNCKVVTGCLSDIKALGGFATAFCSSYLHVPSATTVTTTTTGTESTITSTVTTTVTTVTVTTSSIVVTKRDVNVRDARNTARGNVLGKWAAAEISSACSCLSVKPGKTVTSTVSVPGGTTSTTVTDSVTATVTTTTCNPPGGPCTLYNNCCDGICVLINDYVTVNTCL